MREGTRRALQEVGLPEEAVLGTVRVTMIGRTRVMVQNHRGILQLTQEMVRVRTREGILCIQGKGMTMREMTPECLDIQGEIASVSQ